MRQGRWQTSCRGGDCSERGAAELVLDPRLQIHGKFDCEAPALRNPWRSFHTTMKKGACAWWTLLRKRPPRVLRRRTHLFAWSGQAHRGADSTLSSPLFDSRRCERQAVPEWN